MGWLVGSRFDHAELIERYLIMCGYKHDFSNGLNQHMLKVENITGSDPADNTTFRSLYENGTCSSEGDFGCLLGGPPEPLDKTVNRIIPRA